MAMKILDTMRKQYCAYWAPTGKDALGNTTFAAPVNLRVRWEETTETFVNRTTGAEQRSRSKVWLGQDVLETGVLWLGPGNGLSSADPVGGLTTPQKQKPFSNRNAWEISRFDKTPLLRPKTDADFARVAYL